VQVLAFDQIQSKAMANFNVYKSILQIISEVANVRDWDIYSGSYSVFLSVYLRV
jgi:hypothetical protein